MKSVGCKLKGIRELSGYLRAAHYLLEEWGLWSKIEAMSGNYKTIFKKKHGKSPIYGDDVMMRVDSIVATLSPEHKLPLKRFYLQGHDIDGPACIEKAIAAFCAEW